MAVLCQGLKVICFSIVQLGSTEPNSRLLLMKSAMTFIKNLRRYKL